MYMKLNNKGFAVSAILYSFLTVFILFLLVVLSAMNNSITILKSTNDDIINGFTFEIKQTYGTSINCDNDWYTYNYNKKIEIRTTHDVLYWPKDFNASGTDTKSGFVSIYFSDIENNSIDADNFPTPNNPASGNTLSSSYKYVYVYDKVIKKVEHIEIGNICP